MSGAEGLYAGVDEQELEELAERFLAAILAVIEFGRGGRETPLFHAATIKALIYAQAALMVHPDAPPEAALEEAIVAHDLALRAAIADFRSDQ